MIYSQGHVNPMVIQREKLEKALIVSLSIHLSIPCITFPIVSVILHSQKIMLKVILITI